MESIYTELALYGSKNECARTDNVIFPISEVCDGTVSLSKLSEILYYLYNKMHLLIKCLVEALNEIEVQILVLSRFLSAGSP